MTQDEIIAMGYEARLCDEEGCDDNSIIITDHMTRFAKLVAERERENNVKLLMRLADVYEHADKQGSADDIYKIVDHIRARGKA